MLTACYSVSAGGTDMMTGGSPPRARHPRVGHDALQVCAATTDVSDETKPCGCKACQGHRARPKKALRKETGARAGGAGRKQARDDRCAQTAPHTEGEPPGQRPRRAERAEGPDRASTLTAGEWLSPPLGQLQSKDCDEEDPFPRDGTHPPRTRDRPDVPAPQQGL